MKSQASDDELMIRFFLGDISEQEREAIEERFFQDDQFFEELLAMEEQLISDYAKGLLDSSQHEKFERVYLNSPEKRKRVEFAKDMAKVLAEREEKPQGVQPQPGRGWFGLSSLPLLFARPRFSVVFAAVLVLSLSTWFVRGTLRLRSEVRALQDSQAELKQTETQLRRLLQTEKSQSTELAERLDLVRRQRDELEKEIAQLRNPRQAILSLVLAPQLPRGIEEAPRLAILPGATSVRLILPLSPEDTFKRYEATIRAVEGDHVINLRDLRKSTASSGTSLSTIISSAALRTGDYILTLRGSNSPSQSEELADYYFRVIR